MLVFHANAGSGVSPETLKSDLHENGYEVVHVCDSHPDLAAAAEAKADMFVVAGGDGTVSRAAVALRGQPLPMAILPMGTANNIASTLGLIRPLPELMASWKKAARVKLDIGNLRGSQPDRRFVESVGSGLITDTIEAMDADPQARCRGPAEGEQCVLETYRNVLSRMPLRRVLVTVDDEIFVCDTLLFEVLNFNSIGSSVKLSSTAKPDDGLFTIVWAEERQREQLDAYFLARLAGKRETLDLPTRHGHHVRVSGLDRVHVDDEIRQVQGQMLDLRNEAGSVTVLV